VRRLVWAVRGWAYRRAVAERSLPAPIQWEVDMVVDVRRAREAVPRWQRIGFTVLLGILLGALLDPGYVFWAMIGLVLTAIGWPLLRWRSRLPAVAASLAWATYMIGWRHTVPLAGLTLFGRWYCSRTAAEWADYRRQARAGLVECPAGSLGRAGSGRGRGRGRGRALGRSVAPAAGRGRGRRLGRKRRVLWRDSRPDRPAATH